MKNLFKNFFASLPLGAKLLVLTYVCVYPIAYLGLATHSFNLYGGLGLCPALVWKGQVWRVLTWGLLPANAVDWLVGTFWLATFVSLVARNWSSPGFWIYCLTGIFGASLFVLALRPGFEGIVFGSGPLVFALLVAWDWLYKNERIILLGLGEMSVRQAVILIGIIDSVILFFSCGGWFLMLAAWCGGVAGWIYFFVRSKFFLRKTPQQIRSERVARLEL
jgi:membrane associated rhomboid family serine protease